MSELNQWKKAAVSAVLRKGVVKGPTVDPFSSQSMKGFYLRDMGRRRHAAAIGLINLICILARYEQIVRLKRLPRTAAGRARIKTRNDRQLNKRNCVESHWLRSGEKAIQLPDSKHRVVVLEK